MKELDTENANGIADDDDLLMKEVIGEDSDLFSSTLTSETSFRRDREG